MAATAAPWQQRLDLWLAPAPADGDLRACAAGHPERSWALARAGALLAQGGDGVRLQELGQVTGHGVGWTQRCFQLRSAGGVLLRGAVVPAESARRLAPPLWVMVLETGAGRHPDMRLGCGFPASVPAALSGCGPWPPAGIGQPPAAGPDRRP